MMPHASIPPHLETALLSAQKPPQASGYNTNPANKTLADLPAGRKVLLSSQNPEACKLGKRLQHAQEQLEKGAIDKQQHAAQCEAIVLAAQALRGPGQNKLPPQEYSTVYDDAVLQCHPQQGVAATIQKRARDANASARSRRHMQNMLQPAPAAGAQTQSSRLAIPIKVASQLSDATAAGLSYSTAVLSNNSSYPRGMALGAAWTASAAFDGIDHGALTTQRDKVDLASDAANFSAGVLSMVATGLGHAGNFSQTAVNTAATGSNTLWAAAGGLAAVSGIRNGYGLSSQPGASALAYTASALQFAGGVANAAAAGAGIRSTVTSNGNDADMNRLSASLWMAGTALNTAGTIAGEMAAKRKKHSQQPRTRADDSAV